MYGEHSVVASDRYATRFYFRLDSLPNATTILLRYRNAAALTVGNILISSTNVIFAQDSANAVVTGGGGTVALTANTIYRMESSVKVSTGEIEWKLFAGDSTTVLDTKYVAGQALGIDQVTKLRWGRAAGSSWIGAIDYDSIAAEELATGYIGPISSASTTVRPTNVVSNVGAFTNVGAASSLFASLADELDTTYIQSPANPSATDIVFGLPELSAGNPTIRLRHNVDAASPAISATYSLMQGATVISTRTVTPLPTVITDYSWTATSGETALITDRTQLSLRISTTV
jgi:hypothetical protein